jgi:DNA/RNA-binding domain of Phe-tRNA-synthetase-like protein
LLASLVASGNDSLICSGTGRLHEANVEDGMNYEIIAKSAQAERVAGDATVLGKRLRLSRNRGSADYAPEWATLHETWRGKPKGEVRSHPLIRAYSDFYARIGLDPAKSPPSVEMLILRFLRKDCLDRIPVIHPIVDAVNTAAVEHLIPLGVFDAGRVEGELQLAVTQGGEAFHPLGADRAVGLEAGVLVLRDAGKVLSQFASRDGEAQKITAHTESIWLLGCQVPGVEQQAIVDAMDRAADLLTRTYELEEPEKSLG